MDLQVLRSIWPVFSAETREQIQTIGAKVLGLEQDPAGRDPDLMVTLKRLVHSLKGSAGSLGLEDIEKVAHAIEDGIEQFEPTAQLSSEVVQTTLQGLSAIEAAVARGDAGENPVISGLDELLALLGSGAAGGGNGAGETDGFAAQGLSTLGALEAALGELCSPRVQDRALKVNHAVELALSLQAAAEGNGDFTVGRLAEDAARCFGQLAGGGDSVGQAASNLAGALVELRSALSAGTAAAQGPAKAQRAAAPAAPAAAAAAPAAPAKAEPAGPAGGAGEKVVRVSEKTLDSLALQVEQLVSARAQQARQHESQRELLEIANQALLQLERVASQLTLAGDETSLEPLRAGVGEVRRLQKGLLELAKVSGRESEQLGLVSQVVRDDLRDLRMVPASQMLEPLRRAVREVAGKLGKDVELVLAGTEVRIDRRILEALRDPLMHLVRNAVDHGLEAPEERLAAGKSARGRLEVRVEPRGTRIAVIVSDDGGGLDPARVRATAVRRGLLSSEAAAQLTDAQAARLVFQPGFSTRESVTSISGRGVGLDVVQSTATRLQGAVHIQFTPGQGTRFTVDLPLTLAAALGLLVRSGTSVVALPSDAVKRVLRLAPGDVGTVAGRVLAKVDQEQLPFHTLSEAIGMPRLPIALDSRKVQPAVLLSLGEDRAVFAIDEIVGQQEIVVRPLGRHLAAVTHLAGASVLDDGRLVPVLNAPELLRAATPVVQGNAQAQRPRILVCDDSLTTRFAMKSLLEIAGYPVVTAADGEEAFEVLERTRCQLVVSDWQMPRLDGVGLARRIKSHASLSRTPIILVTSLDSPEDRAAGLEAGADGYIVKKDVQKGKLLDLVRQLLPAASR